MTKIAMKVVITDDDPVSVFLISKFVIKSGLSANPIGFGSGIETLDYLRNNSSDTRHLLLLDINMPEVSGWSVLDRLSEGGYTDAHVIIVSSSINGEDFRKAQTYSRVIGYIEKPVSIDQIQGIMQSAAYKNAYAAE